MKDTWWLTYNKWHCLLLEGVPHGLSYSHCILEALVLAEIFNLCSLGTAALCIRNPPHSISILPVYPKTETRMDFASAFLKYYGYQVFFSKKETGRLADMFWITKNLMVTVPSFPSPSHIQQLSLEFFLNIKPHLSEITAVAIASSALFTVPD